MASYLDNGLREYCSGCGACKEACPKQCISMKQMEDGFLFPVINSEACIHCDKCKRTCPYNNLVEKNSTLACYSGSSKNHSISEISSSGGLFYELARKVIESGGIVAGAKFDSDYNCVHALAYSLDELIPLLGSKYVQSECSSVFSEIENELKSGKTVLFSGTPCQVVGLKNFLNKEYDNLICIDVACHGVPSAADFNLCKAYLERKHGGKLSYIKFRDKKQSGWYHSLTYIIQKNGKTEGHTLAPYKVPYYYFFLWSRNIRKSCYQCPYVGTERVGDITLADYWRAEKEYTENHIGNGISAILCNTVKGIHLFKSCKLDISYRKAKLENIIESNQPFLGHTKEYPNRTQLLENIFKFGYKDTASYIGKKTYLMASLKAVVSEKMKRSIRRRLGAKKK